MLTLKKWHNKENRHLFDSGLSHAIFLNLRWLFFRLWRDQPQSLFSSTIPAQMEVVMDREHSERDLWRQSLWKIQTLAGWEKHQSDGRSSISRCQDNNLPFFVSLWTLWSAPLSLPVFPTSLAHCQHTYLSFLSSCTSNKASLSVSWVDNTIDKTWRLTWITGQMWSFTIDTSIYPLWLCCAFHSEMFDQLGWCQLLFFALRRLSLLISTTRRRWLSRLPWHKVSDARRERHGSEP